MDLLDLFVKIGVDDSGLDKGLNEAESKSEGVLGKLASSVGKVGKFMVKAGAAAIGAAATAIGVVTKQSVEGYAEYEQMVGGIKKLYGNMGMTLEEYAESMKDYAYTPEEIKTRWEALEDAQNTVLNNAKNAFKTAGMSANQYMDIATSFSAALISDLDDTQAAAEMTDVAMKAISDNWNTFGGDLGMIQGAFQGFAKQNYTMLKCLAA